MQNITKDIWWQTFMEIYRTEKFDYSSNNPSWDTMLTEQCLRKKKKNKKSKKQIKRSAFACRSNNTTWRGGGARVGGGGKKEQLEGEEDLQQSKLSISIVVHNWENNYIFKVYVPNQFRKHGLICSNSGVLYKTTYSICHMFPGPDWCL